MRSLFGKAHEVSSPSASGLAEGNFTSKWLKEFDATVSEAVAAAIFGRGQSSQDEKTER